MGFEITRFVPVSLKAGYPEAWFQKQHALGYIEKQLAKPDDQGNIIWQVFFPDLTTSASVPEPYLKRLCAINLDKVTARDTDDGKLYSHTLIMEAFDPRDLSRCAVLFMKALRAHWPQIVTEALPLNQTHIAIGVWAHQDLTASLRSLKGA